jgi:hypothetical protein
LLPVANTRYREVLFEHGFRSSEWPKTILILWLMRFEFLSVAWPQDVQEVSILGYSMGRLLARSEMHYSAQAHHR